MRINLEELATEETPELNVQDALDQVEDTEEQYEDVNADMSAAGQLAGAAAGIEAILEVVRAQGLGDDRRRGVMLATTAVRSQLQAIGLEHLFQMPSMESMDTMTDEQLIASLEGLVGRIWNAVTDAGSKLMKGAEDFFKNFYQDSYDLAGQARALKEELAKRGTTAKVETIEISQAHKLHLSGETSPEAIVKGFNNLVHVNKESYARYIEAVKVFYKNYFRAFQEIVGTANWYEKLATQSTLIGNFINNVKKDLDAAFKAGDDRTEISGGKVFDCRNIVINNLPELKNKNPSLKVDSRQTIRVLTHKEMNQLLDLIIQNSEIIKGWWKRYYEFVELHQKARAEAAADSKNIDQNRFFKLLSRVSSSGDINYWHWDLVRPINALAWHSLSVTRSLLKVLDKSVNQYPRNF